MTKKETLKLFEERKVRTVWDDEKEKWYFSIVDVVSVLTDSVDATAYWRKLKQRLKEEGNETVTNCHGLKMKATDGKMRLTDVADTEQLLRIIQSIPSPKAEPFKQWMAHVASERLDQMQDPELSIEQAMMDYKRLGLMGDAGSRAIGIFIAFTFLKLHAPLLYIPMALIIILDGGLGLIKVSFMRFLHINLMKNLRTPIHDHMRKNKDWSDTQVVFRFTIIQVILGLAVIYGLMF